MLRAFGFSGGIYEPNFSEVDLTGATVFTNPHVIQPAASAHLHQILPSPLESSSPVELFLLDPSRFARMEQ